MVDLGRIYHVDSLRLQKYLQLLHEIQLLSFWLPRGTYSWLMTWGLQCQQMLFQAELSPAINLPELYVLLQLYCTPKTSQVHFWPCILFSNTNNIVLDFMISFCLCWIIPFCWITIEILHFNAVWFHGMLPTSKLLNTMEAWKII